MLTRSRLMMAKKGLKGSLVLLTLFLMISTPSYAQRRAAASAEHRAAVVQGWATVGGREWAVDTYHLKGLRLLAR